MSESNSYGRRDNESRGRDSRDGSSRDSERRNDRRPKRDDRSSRGERGSFSRDERRGGSRDDHRDNRRDDRGGYGKRDDRRDDRGGYGKRDDRRGGGSRDDRRDNRRDDRGGYGKRDDRRDNRRDDRGGYGKRDDRRDDRGGYGKRDDRRGGSRDDRRDGWDDEQKKSRSFSPQKSGFREQRLENRANDPDLPNDIDPDDLDPSVLQDLKSLSKENADATAKHMIMAAMWMEDDPQLALRHARAAKDRAGRVSVAREVNGIAAYRAGEWKEALAELRAARRISGGPGMLAVMADCERGMGRPEKAIELGRSDEARELSREGAIELAIVVAGARQDLGQDESALVTIERANPDKKERGMGATRLAYAYANAFAELGQVDKAREWFEHTVEIDEGGWTDAAQRLEELK
ncbi:hypothetical protein [Corynebacterium phocae]|uniref:hypothetical protein n=1 Tax=Corynebacterium phocae TaxID=161895 RepID=UPI00123B1707|nr:hypothetical protein [Corynebacterium phocae]KAA8725179.1 hypothetical protein F4V58_05910 [Corynebacterium phocae]